MPTTDLGIPYWAGADPATLASYFQQQAEATDDAIPIRSAGKSIIAAEQSRTNTAYGELGTPDRVSGIVMPTDGLVVVGFQARWKCSGGSSVGRAAIFIGANQLKLQGIAGPAVIEAACDGAADRYRPLYSCSDTGLDSSSTPLTDGAADATTGQLIGSGGAGTSGGADGLAVIHAAAGTYDISVQFKASSGSVTAKERKLWVWSMAFG